MSAATKPQPITKRAQPTSVERAPAEAFRLAVASPFMFSEAVGEPSDTASAPFSMLARTGDPIEHWYWGRIVHDFAGMSHRDTIPVDYCHQTWEPIGKADKFEIKDGSLFISGTIEPIAAGDEASKLIARSRKGIPYQASIHFDPFSMVVEYIGEGMSAEVNGRTVQGPVVVAREWTLRGLAFCPHGADVGTEAKIDADGVGEFSLTWKGKAMSTKADNTTPPADAGQLGDTPSTTTPPAATTQLADDGRAKFTAELKRFTDRFPEVGAGYFADGLDYQAASDRFIDKLSADLVAARKERDEVAEKLKAAQLSLGEGEAIKTSGSATNAKSFDSLFGSAKK